MVGLGVGKLGEQVNPVVLLVEQEDLLNPHWIGFKTPLSRRI